MSKVSDNNEEQFRMLLMVIEDVRSGICLFQSEEQSKWAGRIQREQDGRKLIVHNIADDDDAGMPVISDFRNWSIQADADIVVVYNLQMLGIRFGDAGAFKKDETPPAPHTRLVFLYPLPFPFFRFSDGKGKPGYRRLLET